MGNSNSGFFDVILNLGILGWAGLLMSALLLSFGLAILVIKNQQIGVYIGLATIPLLLGCAIHWIGNRNIDESIAMYGAQDPEMAMNLEETGRALVARGLFFGLGETALLLIAGMTCFMITKKERSE